MCDVIIIGAGGHAAEIDEYVRHSSILDGRTNWKIIGFIDDNSDSYNAYQFSAPYLGTIKDHEVLPHVFYLIGIANLKYRKPLISLMQSKGAQFMSFIHATAYVSLSAKIGLGTIIGPNVNIGPNVVIGNFNLINSRCSMGHDTSIGSYNFISPNVCFSGFTAIGDENLFGINSVTIPKIKIGNGNKIAAGMVLDQNVNDHEVVFYRFKEKVIAVPR